MKKSHSANRRLILRTGFKVDVLNDVPMLDRLAWAKDECVYEMRSQSY